MPNIHLDVIVNMIVIDVSSNGASRVTPKLAVESNLMTRRTRINDKEIRVE